MRSLIAYGSGEHVEVVHKSTEDSGLYMQRLMFLEYMSGAENDKSAQGLREFAEILQVPTVLLRKWKYSPSFQHLLARRIRDRALDGLGLAMAYEELMKIIADHEVPVKIRQKAAVDLAKLSMKQDEMYLRYKMAKERNKEPANKRTYEQAVIEAEYEVLSEEPDDKS